MGSYLNPDNEKFIEAIRSEIYVDKTDLIAYTNSVVQTNQKYVCVSRPRRFGKSITANMLCAYYSRGCDSHELFSTFHIASHTSFETYLNKYNLLFLNIQEFLSRTTDIENMITLLKKRVLWELLKAYPDADVFDQNDLIGCMQDIYDVVRVPFIIVIDEWDCVLREYKQNKEAQKYYLDSLRDLLKDKAYIHLAYMTGILPIKKYGTHSALNMFDEFSMTSPGPLAQYVGFTSEEVSALCLKYSMSMETMKE